MTGETVECFNCGRANPSWAQVCRYCGVPLVAGVAAAEPSGLFPTDQRSLISMGAAIGTIVAAVIVGLILSSLNPTDPTVGVATSPTPHPSITVRPSASTPPVATPTPEPTPTPTPALPGTLVLGGGRNRQTCEISGETDTFAPGSVFAQSITLDEAFGVSALGEEVSRVTDGKEKVVQSRQSGQVAAPSRAKVVCYATAANNLIKAWGAGTYIMRVYRGDEKIAEAGFKLTK
jgi:hypothetical protein